MSSDTIGLMFTIVTTAVGATWALRSKLGDLETLMRAHVDEDARLFGELTTRVIKLEKRRK